MARVVYRNFTGGEVTPSLSSRYDLQKFGSFLQCCENFIPNLHGDVERRPGTRFIADLGEKCVLLPFSFNTEQENNYVLIFGASTIRVADENGVISGVSMSNPYSLSDVYKLSFSQVADVLYIAHKNYALRKITRTGASPNYIWAISAVSFNQTIAAPGTPSVQWKKSSDDDKSDNYKLQYVVTAVDSDGVESIASGIGSVTGKYPTDWISGSYVRVSWGAVSGAKEYNIYRESAGYFGFIGVATSTYFDDQNFEPNTAMTPKENWYPFSGDNHPATVCFFQQRMCLGGTKDNPAAFYMSRTGDYESFRKSSPLQDDDPVEYMLASGSIDDVKWLVPFGDLLIGTSGAEFKATSSGAAITSSDVQITSQSYWGSADLQPIVIGQSILHCQRSGHHIRDLFYSWESDGYSGTDLSVLAPQEVEQNSLLQWCYQQSSGANIWLVRDDGVLLCLTYMKEQNVFAWSRHVTDGEVLSVASLNSGEDGDTVMMVVRRTINGATKYFLERLEKRFLEDTPIANAWFVDCGKEVTSSYAATVFTGFDHLKNKQVAILADGAPLELTTVNSNGAIQVPYPVKKVIVGLNFKSCLSPLPVETDLQTGSTLGKRRAYGKCVLRLHNSVCGKYAATEQGDLFTVDAWKTRTQYDIPFLPVAYGAPVEPFSGDIEITLPSGQDTDTSLYIIQDRPLPFRLVAVTMDVDFGEE